MDSFLMAARVVIPMAMLMAVGIVVRMTKIAEPGTMKKVDTLIFKVFTPCLVFYNVYTTDLTNLTNPGFLLYGIFGLAVSFCAALILFRVIPQRPTATAFAQSMIRPNYIIFGAAVAQSIYGEGNIGLVMLMGAVAIPVYSIMAAVILEYGRGGNPTPGQLFLAVLRNPIFVGTALGLVVNLSGLRLPELVSEVVQDLGGIATPLSFLSIGVGLSFTAYPKKALVAAAVAVRLVLIPLVFVTGGVLLGFQGAQLCALMILFAAPAAVASYPAAVAMGADGEFAGQLVAYSTIFCLPTIFLWTLALNLLGLL